MSLEGEQFLHQKDPSLHTSDKVEYEQERREKLDIDTHQKPAEKISDWLKILDRTHTSHRDDPGVMERIKNYYHKEYVIKKEDIPESAFLAEQRIARNAGYGDIEITDEFREQKAEQIIKDQTESLDKWVDYLTSPDADVYPTWAKYWAFKSLVNMGKFEKSDDDDKQKAKFTQRRKDTISPYPPFNAAAFALTIGAIEKKIEQKNLPKDRRVPVLNVSANLSDEEFNNLLSGESFSNLYAQFLIEQPIYSKEGLEEIRGEWKTYKKGSKPDELVESLEGYPLEWCIRNSGTARDYLASGDMHIFYSFDQEGNPVVPRAAIRMLGDHISEVRGIAPDQNVDPYITPVIQEKLKDFPDGDKYEKKSSDMKRVTEIETKIKKGEQLTKDDLRFLYEVDSKIQGFGYHRDPRVDELLSGRNPKEDLAEVFECSQDEISLKETEALSGNIKFHYGNLNLSHLTSAEGLTLPQSVGGVLYLSRLTSAEGLTLPQSLGGGLYLSRLTSAEGLTLPQSLGGSLDLSGLTTTEGLTLPQSVGGGLYLSRLTTTEGLTLPKFVDGDLYLDSLTSAEKNKLRSKFPNLKIL